MILTRNLGNVDVAWFLILCQSCGTDFVTQVAEFKQSFSVFSFSVGFIFCHMLDPIWFEGNAHLSFQFWIFGYSDNFMNLVWERANYWREDWDSKLPFLNHLVRFFSNDLAEHKDFPYAFSKSSILVLKFIGMKSRTDIDNHSEWPMKNYINYTYLLRNMLKGK
jgi:hypothetical protein